MQVEAALSEAEFPREMREVLMWEDGGQTLQQSMGLSLWDAMDKVDICHLLLGPEGSGPA